VWSEVKRGEEKGGMACREEKVGRKEERKKREKKEEKDGEDSECLCLLSQFPLLLLFLLLLIMIGRVVVFVLFCSFEGKMLRKEEDQDDMWRWCVEEKDGKEEKCIKDELRDPKGGR
jgi:hypothetical protein